MGPQAAHRRGGAVRRALAGGFTLVESVMVVGLLAFAVAGLLALQPQVLKTQDNGRDQFVGQDLMRACAERLLAVRRNIGYASVRGSSDANPTCNGMGGIGGFASNPSVTLRDASATSVTSCSSATCTATITIAKTSGTAATLTPITLQLSPY
jgi:type II secretory pathway pseudopilin PulG